MNGKKIDISCPEKVYQAYVQKVAPVHDSRSRYLPGPIVKALNQIQDCLTVLDVCGGTGRIAKYLVNQGHVVKIVDNSPDMLSRAKRKGLNVQIQDARHLEEEPASYDAVICLGNSLAGIPSKVGRFQAIQEIVRVSREYVIIDCLNRLPDFITTWLPLYVRVCLGMYRPGLNLRKDVVTGTAIGDIVYHDKALDSVLYHYVYSALELKAEMQRAGLHVQAGNCILSKRVVLVGRKRWGS